MNCREFRFAHLDYTDGTLGPAEHAAAQSHADDCAACARLDCLVRRGVLLVRNLPAVPARPGFYQRLAARLAAEGVGGRARCRTTVFATATAAAAIALVAGLVVLSARSGRSSPAMLATMTPLAAPAPPPPMMRRDVMSALHAGVPLWPVATLLDETPVRFVSAPPVPLAPSR